MLGCGCLRTAIVKGWKKPEARVYRVRGHVRCGISTLFVRYQQDGLRPPHQQHFLSGLQRRWTDAYQEGWLGYTDSCSVAP